MIAKLTIPSEYVTATAKANLVPASSSYSTYLWGTQKNQGVVVDLLL